ncbi:MAG: peptidoglycan DD-metalloendopeptidase family protein [Polaromonas sp.]|nr:peptidoglycan DD-metalloendopeptidase family protein [Polaromonas sp.]
MQLGQQRLLATLVQHPKRIAGTLAVLLLGTGVTAFGVAPLAPDASDLPVRQIVEVVQPLPSQAQVDALLDYQFNLFRTEITRSTDTAETLLRRLNIDDADAAAFLRSDSIARTLLLSRAGRTVTAETSDDQRLLKLSMRWATEDDTQFKRLVIARNGKAFSSRIESAPYSISTRMASGNIKSSLFAATDDANIPDAVASQIANIFSGDIDFHRSLRKGDRFSVFYETLEADGEAIKTGKVLSTEFINNGKAYQAMWFNDPAQVASAVKASNKAPKGSYYSLDGQSLRKAYLASPMEFSRMSSGFKMRFHPILQTWRAHLGVDYAAPTGTAVRSIGDGVVDFAGVQNGFGNVVFINHKSGHTTVYAHLSRINVQRGARVSQGQNIGAVGSTGWATGPHLHFEFRVNGKHQDPTLLAQRSETVPLTASSMPAFKQLAGTVRQQLQIASTIGQSRAE